MNYFINYDLYDKIEDEIEKFINESNPKPDGEEAFKTIDTIISNLFTEEEFKFLETIVELEPRPIYLIVKNGSSIDITKSIKDDQISDEFNWREEGYKISFKIKYLPKMVNILPDFYIQKLNEYINESLDNPVKRYILDSISWIKKTRSLRKKYKVRRTMKLKEESKHVQDFILSEFKGQLDQFYNDFFKTCCDALDIPYYEPKAKFKSCQIDSFVNKINTNELKIFIRYEFDKYYCPMEDWISSKIHKAYNPTQYKIFDKLQYMIRQTKIVYLVKDANGTIKFNNVFNKLKSEHAIGFSLKMDDIYSPYNSVSDYIVDFLNQKLENDPDKDKIVNGAKILLSIEDSIYINNAFFEAFEHTDELPDMFKSIVYHLYKRNQNDTNVRKDFLNLMV